MTHGSLFSGIGGFDLAAEWMGWENIFHCEWNPFGQKVLKYYWPEAISYEDITNTDFSVHRGQIDILTGGFPCQPFSVAGKRKGKEDDRYLWPEMLRAIDEIRPRWIVGENVAGLATMVQPEIEETNVESQASILEEDDQEVITEVREYVIETIFNDLERIGYSVQPLIIPACATGAPHRRDRIWFIANAIDDNGRGTQSRWAEKRERFFIESERLGEKWPSTNSNSNGYWSNDRFRETGRQEGEGESIRDKRERLRDDNRRDGSEGNATDTNCKQRCEGRLYTAESKTSERYTCSCNACINKRDTWDNFPTQSPIRNGNDGFSTESLRQRIRKDCMGVLSEKEIDKIISEAHTEWSNESIKAGGNAIVPQVVYQIFKAIEEYEILNRNT